MAHKKAGGSSRNGRDFGRPPSRREEVRRRARRSAAYSSYVSAAPNFIAGRNVGMGTDHTLFATAAGEVAFERKGDGRQYVSVRSTSAAE